MTMPDPQHQRLPLVFISYAREDYVFADRFLQHLKPLEHQGRAEVFMDTDDVRAGDDWQETIDEALETAEVYVVLMSRNFFNSSVCRVDELPVAVQRHHQGDARLLLVLLQDYAWQGYDVGGQTLGGIQAVGPFDRNRQLIPLATAESNQIETHMRQVYDKVVEALEERSQAGRQQPRPDANGTEAPPVTLSSGLSLESLFPSFDRVEQLETAEVWVNSLLRSADRGGNTSIGGGPSTTLPGFHLFTAFGEREIDGCRYFIDTLQIHIRDQLQASQPFQFLGQIVSGQNTPSGLAKRVVAKSFCRVAANGRYRPAALYPLPGAGSGDPAGQPS
jgi:hypothetical protein